MLRNKDMTKINKIGRIPGGVYQYLIDSLSYSLIKRGCRVFMDQRSGYREVREIFVVYQGSIDPGTIKSKYIPTISDIVEIIEKSFRNRLDFKAIKGLHSAFPFDLALEHLRGTAYEFSPKTDVDNVFDDSLRWSGVGGITFSILNTDEKVLQNNFRVMIFYYVPSLIVNAVLK